MTSTLKAVTVKLPEPDLVRIGRRNRSKFIRRAVTRELDQEAAKPWEPKTAGGKRRAALRAAFIKRGGELLDVRGLADELRARRGGLA